MRLDTRYWMCRRFRSKLTGRVFHEVWATGQRVPRLAELAEAAKAKHPTKSFVVRSSAAGKTRALRAFGRLP